ncbi:transient receptor potential cation channel subfamily A member 1 homolog [Lepeophtheirus salmonis]
MLSESPIKNDPNLLVCKIDYDEEPKTRSLFQLVREGDLFGLKGIISGFPTDQIAKRINILDENKISCLHYATRYAHLPILEYLIGHGANVNILGDGGLTPLHFAARFKKLNGIESYTSSRRSSSYRGSSLFLNKAGVKKTNDKEEAYCLLNNVLDEIDKLPMPPSVISYLILSGAKVNEKDSYGLSPLHYAAMRGNYQATRELLQCIDIQIEIRDQQNLTPLHLACVYGHIDVVRLLLSKGARIQSSGEHNQNVLHKASSVGKIEILELIVNDIIDKFGEEELQMLLLEDDSDGNSPLLLAVEGGCTKTVEYLIKKGSDVNYSNASKSTALHIACKIGNIDIVKVLIQERAHIDSLNGQYQTPLMMSCKFNNVDITDYLLTCGASIERKDKHNHTPLLLASMDGNIEAVRMLLERGADIFALDRTDKSAIFLAAESNNPNTLMALLQDCRSFDLVNFGDHFDNSPLHVAALKGYEEIVDVLLEFGADIAKKNDDEQTPLHLAAKEGQKKIVMDILKRDRFSVNDSDFESHTSLHLACIFGHSKVVSTLIAAGADIEARNYCLWTPLDCAAAYGQTKCANLLLNANAPIDARDKNKTTPLHLSARYGHENVAKLLIKNGASLWQSNSAGHNALTLAITHGKREVARVIIESDNWMGALNSSFQSLQTGLRETPLRLLIKQFPDLAKLVFDRCLTTNLQSHNIIEESKNNRHTFSASSSDDERFAITFNYELLDDTYIHLHNEMYDMDTSTKEGLDEVWDDNGRLLSTTVPYCFSKNIIKNNHPLMLMVKEKRVDLLGHPLCMALVRLKWNKFGRYVYYLNLSVYLMFVLFLTFYILETPAPYSIAQIFNLGKMKSSLDEGLKKKITNGISNSSSETLIDICSLLTKEDISEGKLKRVYLSSLTQYVIMLLCTVHILKEIFLFTQDQLAGPILSWARLSYFSFENLVEWTCYILASILVYDFDECQQITGLRSGWQWQIGAVIVTLSWLNLLSNVRKVPLLGIYVVMFSDVLKTFLKFSIICGLFIVAFSLGFQTLLGGQENFNTIDKSMMKTIVMMIGEFEYDDIFYDNVRNAGETLKRSSLPYSYLTQGFFLVFLIIMPIIIMNLLVGLAVDDIKAVQDNAVLQRLAMQVTLNLDVEKLLPDCLRRKFLIRKEKIYPNKQSQGWGDPTLTRITQIILAGRRMSDLEQLTKKQEELMGKFKIMKEQFKKVYEELAHLRLSFSTLYEREKTQKDKKDVIIEIDRS